MLVTSIILAAVLFVSCLLNVYLLKKYVEGGEK